MDQLVLEPKSKAVLDRIRHSSKFLSIFEMPSDLAEAEDRFVRQGMVRPGVVQAVDAAV
jgi:hypothetical protein